MQHIHNFMTFDPGVNTGWAHWDSRDTLYPAHTGIFHAPGPETPMETRLRFLYTRFRELIDRYDPNFTVIEGTEDWGTAKSRASSQSGALQLLSYIVGGYGALSPAFIIRMPKEWKGGLNDKALELRIARALKQKPGGAVYVEHIREAVGLGLSMLEVL